MKEYKLKVSPEEAGRRLDLFLMDYFRNKEQAFSRTFIQKLISTDKVIFMDSGTKNPDQVKDPLKPHSKVCLLYTSPSPRD